MDSNELSPYVSKGMSPIQGSPSRGSPRQWVEATALPRPGQWRYSRQRYWHPVLRDSSGNTPYFTYESAVVADPFVQIIEDVDRGGVSRRQLENYQRQQEPPLVEVSEGIHGDRVARMVRFLRNPEVQTGLPLDERIVKLRKFAMKRAMLKAWDEERRRMDAEGNGGDVARAARETFAREWYTTNFNINSLVYREIDRDIDKALRLAYAHADPAYTRDIWQTSLARAVADYGRRGGRSRRGGLGRHGRHSYSRCRKEGSSMTRRRRKNRRCRKQL